MVVHLCVHSNLIFSPPNTFVFLSMPSIDSLNGSTTMINYKQRQKFQAWFVRGVFVMCGIKRHDAFVAFLSPCFSLANFSVVNSAIFIMLCHFIASNSIRNSFIHSTTPRYEMFIDFETTDAENFRSLLSRLVEFLEYLPPLTFYLNDCTAITRNIT